jgi:MFS family permease
VTPAKPAERPTILHHLVLIALLVITTINYIQRNSIGAAATTLEEELDVSRVDLDLYAIAAFFWAYTAMMVPSGWLSRRWGPRLALTVFAAGWSLAMLACGLARDLMDLYLARLAMGALQAGIFPCATLILAAWYPPSLRGISTAFLNSFMLIGGATGTLLTGLLLAPLGWRWLFILYSLPGLVWAAWFFWWFRNRPEEHPGVNAAELAVIAEGRPREEEAAKAVVASEPPSRTNWLVLFPSVLPIPIPIPIPSLTRLLVLATSVPLILLCTQQFFRAGANRLFDSRLPTYIEERLGPSTEEEKAKAKREAALMASWPQWAGVFGGLLGGALSDWVLHRTRSRRLARNGVAIGALAGCSALYLLAYFIPDLVLATVVLSAGSFVFCFSSPVSYALTLDTGGKNLAIVFALMNTAGNLGASAFTSSISYFVDLGGWELALSIWLCMHLLALVCWVFLNPEGTIGEPAPKREA